MTPRPLAACVAAAILVLGCSSTAYHHGGPIDPAVDVPTHFLVSGKGGKTEEPAPGSCRNPMIDPRDGTKIILERSGEGRGYYRVPAGRYGVHAGQLLLVECGTGRVIGNPRRMTMVVCTAMGRGTACRWANARMGSRFAMTRARMIRTTAQRFMARPPR